MILTRKIINSKSVYCVLTMCREEWGDIDLVLSSCGLQSNEDRQTTDSKHIQENWRDGSETYKTRKQSDGERQGASLDSAVRKDAKCDHGNET